MKDCPSTATDKFDTSTLLYPSPHRLPLSGKNIITIYIRRSLCGIGPTFSVTSFELFTLQRYNIPRSPIPETSRNGMNLRVIATYRPLSHPRTSFFSPRTSFFSPRTSFLSTDYHRLSQIIKYQRYFDYHRLNHQSIIIIINQ